jgi:acyl transferase domain-containing protein
MSRLVDWVTEHADSVVLSDLAYTLARRRGHRPVRAAVIASSPEELIEGLREVADAESPREAAVGHDDRAPVWVFSGQGSQWAAMGTDLRSDQTTQNRFRTSVFGYHPKTLVADLRTILAPQCVARAREIANRMTKPAESVTAVADLLEDRASRGTQPDLEA